MKYICFTLMVFMNFSALSDDFNGISLGGALVNDEYSTDLWELNYTGRVDPHISIYAGYGLMDLQFKEQYSSHSSSFFGGTQAGFLIHPNSDWIRPYLGLGLYTAEGFVCNGRGHCGHEHIAAIYPEAGIQLSLGHHLQLSGKVRWYEIDRTEYLDEPVYMMSISVYF
jgi:hypothetical protein